jgi:hypothetical protein
MCNEIYTVASPEGAANTSGGGAWRMRTPEGQTYGPIGKNELDSWVTEGRVTADCLLSSDADTAWVNADAVYSALRQAEQPSPTETRRPAGRYIAPHRGGLILTLGIISWAVGCPIFGICAWVMGSSDLREMQAGRMDAGGMGLTQAGQVVGMIHALLFIFVIVLFVFLFLLGIGWR